MMLARLRGRRGQALLEALMVFPMLIASVTFIFSAVFLSVAVFLFEHRLDETLLCFSYRTKPACLAEFESFTRQSVLQRLSPKIALFRKADLLVGRIRFERPWGGEFEISRDLRIPLNEKRR